jgi:hypothetical protein
MEHKPMDKDQLIQTLIDLGVNNAQRKVSALFGFAKEADLLPPDSVESYMAWLIRGMASEMKYLNQSRHLAWVGKSAYDLIADLQTVLQLTERGYLPLSQAALKKESKQ